VAYPNIVPCADDSDKDTERKWREWVEHESYKRYVHIFQNRMRIDSCSLVYHLFEHDMSMTLVKHRNPLLSFSELSLPLPSPRSLWLAPSAIAWKARWLSLEHNSTVLSLKGLLQDDSVIRCLTSDVDEQVAHSVYLYGIAAQVWEHTQQSAVLEASNDASSQLWLQSRQQKLYIPLSLSPSTTIN
jgi:hypothetical protein